MWRGGSFSITHVDLAADVRQRKIDSINRAKATIVASANPGCARPSRRRGVKLVTPSNSSTKLFAR
ncbi:MAG: hypothetical protein R2706_17935 [Acidimicrobiales bacterium]